LPVDRLAEIRVQDFEGMLALLARHLELYKKNKRGMSPDELDLRTKMQNLLNGARSDLQRSCLARGTIPRAVRCAAEGWAKLSTVRIHFLLSRAAPPEPDI
jgi:hypothetical protein